LQPIFKHVVSDDENDTFEEEGVLTEKKREKVKRYKDMVERWKTNYNEVYNIQKEQRSKIRELTAQIKKLKEMLE